MSAVTPRAAKTPRAPPCVSTRTLADHFRYIERFDPTWTTVEDRQGIDISTSLSRLELEIIIRSCRTPRSGPRIGTHVLLLSAWIPAPKDTERWRNYDALSFVGVSDLCFFFAVVAGVCAPWWELFYSSYLREQCYACTHLYK